jgi:hypothetical protein
MFIHPCIHRGQLGDHMQVIVVCEATSKQRQRQGNGFGRLACTPCDEKHKLHHSARRLDRTGSEGCKCNLQTGRDKAGRASFLPAVGRALRICRHMHGRLGCTSTTLQSYRHRPTTQAPNLTELLDQSHVFLPLSRLCSCMPRFQGHEPAI